MCHTLLDPPRFRAGNSRWEPGQPHRRGKNTPARLAGEASACLGSLLPGVWGRRDRCSAKFVGGQRRSWGCLLGVQEGLAGSWHDGTGDGNEELWTASAGCLALPLCVWFSVLLKGTV